MALNALFVTSSAIGIGNFLASLFADQNEAQTIVRVAAALNDYQGLSGADGKVGKIQTYDTNNNLLGLSNSVSVGSGDYTDTGVDQPNKEQVQYVELFADSDAICIAYVSTTWVDGTKWMWVGDWGQPCNLNWYYSGITAGTESNGSGHLTQCTWLDSDDPNTSGSGPTTAGAFKIGVSQYGNNGLVGQDPSTVCHDPMLSAWSDADGTASLFKRDRSATRQRKRVADPRAVISEADQHNATYLCEHPNSKGPDFVSLFEGKHCDMETREVVDLCSATIKTDCFDTKTNSIVGGKKRSAKSYSEIIKW